MIKSVVKHSYIKGRNGKARACKHADYLQHREGEDRDLEEGHVRPFFDAERERVSGREVKAEIRAEHGERGVAVHKMMLSPGVQNVDMKALTREVLNELGHQKGLELRWSAVEHKNTEHTHVHVIIMATDENGQQVRFNRDDYKEICRLQEHYLDRHHPFERYLDREVSNLLREQGYSREGDKEFQRLVEDIHVRDRKERSQEEPEREKDDLDRNWKDHGRGLDRRWSYGEFVRQTQGALEDYHSSYQSDYWKQYWEDITKMDPSRAEEAQQQIAGIDAYLQEQRDGHQGHEAFNLDDLLGELYGPPELYENRDNEQGKPTEDSTAGSIDDQWSDSVINVADLGHGQGLDEKEDRDRDEEDRDRNDGGLE